VRPPAVRLPGIRPLAVRLPEVRPLAVRPLAVRSLGERPLAVRPPAVRPLAVRWSEAFRRMPVPRPEDSPVTVPLATAPGPPRQVARGS
jgi:hypothetical protein